MKCEPLEVRLCDGSLEPLEPYIVAEVNDEKLEDTKDELVLDDGRLDSKA